MPTWPRGYTDQVKQILDDSALPIEEYDMILEKWSKGEYENSKDGETRSLAELQTMIRNQVCETKKVPIPDLHAQAKLAAQKYSKGD
jgi:hypothetical protein